MATFIAAKALGMTLMKAVAVGTVVTVAAPPVVGGALATLGFGSGGIVAHSFAALWQSSIANVATGSIFATLQSVGAAGIGALAAKIVGGFAGLLAAFV